MKVVLVGGTHGNEKTGLYLVQKWRAHGGKGLPEGHEYLILLGNPRAIDGHRRFTDYDLNRSFGKTQAPSSAYESQRAKELSDEVFKWASGEPFFLIDLHTTTANMGVTLVLSKMDRLSARVIKRICDQDPSYHVLLNSDRDDECIFVDSMAPHGLLIEIGPVPQNVYDPRVITLMEKVVVETLEALLEEEASLPTPGPIEVELFQEGPAVKFPGAINGQLTTIVHPDLVGRDYEPLKQGMSVFVDTQGQCVHWQGEDVYPVFINEAAYLTQETAFITTTKANIKF